MNKIRLTLYIETTVFNYFYDEREGHEDVLKLFEDIKAGKFRAYTSRYVTDELEQAPEPKKSDMLNLIAEYGIISLKADPEAEELADKYINAGTIPASHFYDSVHIAMASINAIDIIVSYNFHHINRDKTRVITAAVSKLEGYKPVSIYTAEEVLAYERAFRDGSN